LTGEVKHMLHEHRPAALPAMIGMGDNLLQENHKAPRGGRDGE